MIQKRLKKKMETKKERLRKDKAMRTKGKKRERLPNVLSSIACLLKNMMNHKVSTEMRHNEEKQGDDMKDRRKEKGKGKEEQTSPASRK